MVTSPTQIVYSPYAFNSDWGEHWAIYRNGQILLLAMVIILSLSQESSEKQVKELQHQLGLLKSQLSHSEETQKDFVELSQSLQV